jgi:hypothetical protein
MVMEEIWKKNDEYPKYEVSTFGNVRNIETGYILKQNLRGNYLVIGIFNKLNIQKQIRVHRLVATTFIPNPENKKTVNHKDHNPLNNNVDNLEWFSQAEQNKHKRKTDKNVQSLISSRKIWRADKITGEKLELYQTVRLAARWVFENKLAVIKEFNDGSSIASSITTVAQGKQLTAYGYKWIYEQEENLTNEIWKEIPSNLVNGTKNYFISSLGRVKNHKGRISCGMKHSSGYLMISISSTIYLLHRLVAQVFLPNPENKEQVNHIDGNKENSIVDNLEWCTQQENCIHRSSTGLGNNTKSIIQYDLKMNKLNEFNSIIEASKKLNIFDTSISYCCQGKLKTCGGFIFRYQDDEQSIPDLNKVHNNIVQFDLQMNKLNEFSSLTQASRKLNIHISHISYCCKGITKQAKGFIFRFCKE